MLDELWSAAEVTEELTHDNGLMKLTREQMRDLAALLSGIINFTISASRTLAMRSSPIY